jgi:hypothetical protein
MGDEVDQAVGGSADGLKHDHGVADGGAGDEIAELRAAGDGHLATRLPLASAMWRRSAWVAGAVADIGRLAEGLDEAGHGTRRARYVAGANGGAARPLMSSVSDASTFPALCCGQKRRQSVQAPKTSPL